MQHRLSHLIKLVFCFLIFCQKEILKVKRVLFILKDIKIKTDDKSPRCLTLAVSM